MGYQRPDRAFIDYQAYRWGRLGQEFRGPPPDLDRPYVACIGGAQTFGRYVARPWPALLGDRLDRQTANFGAADAGPGFYLADSQVLEALCDADLCIVQVMSARALSNRLYQVRPRRNHQLKSVSPALRRMFPHIGDDAFASARDLLDAAAAEDADRFLAIVEELRAAWVARMRSLLRAIHTRKILFWFSERTPDEGPPPGARVSATKDPHHVDRAMLDALDAEVDATVLCVTKAGMPQPLLVDGAPVLRTPFGAPIRDNRRYPSPEMHEAAAAALAPVAAGLLSAPVDF